MKTSTKTTLGVILYMLLYAVILYASLCLGYLHPFFWVYASLTSSLFAAIPFLYLASKWKKFGVGTALSLLFAGICAIMGEGGALNYLVMVAMGLLVDCIRWRAGNEKLGGVRAAYPLFALLPFGRTMVVWTDRASTLTENAAEMGAPYADAMAAVSSVWMLILMIIATALVACIAERVTERLMKKSAATLMV